MNGTTKYHSENFDSLVEKGGNSEGLIGVVNAQKTLIEQQKVLIEWLTGQIVHPDASPSEQVPKSFKQFLKKRPVYSWLAGLLLAVMSIAFVVLFFYLYNTSATPVPTPGHDDNLGDDIQIIQREQWNAVPPLNVTKRTDPARMVRIMHTGGSNCSDVKICSDKVHRLQGWQIATKGMTDLGYNYMIGGDGNVYIGRGPDVVGASRPDSIDIGYIGNFLTPYDKMTAKMEEASKQLIEKLRKKGYTTPDYVVVAQNHTVATLSPGQNIYEKIVNWPHFDSGTYFKTYLN